MSCEEGDEGKEGCEPVYSENAEYCFTNNGTGTVKTELNDIFCEANTSVRFNSSEQENTELIVKELTEQTCEFNERVGSIVAREYICQLNIQNLIECQTTSNRGRTGKITLRRLE